VYTIKYIVSTLYRKHNGDVPVEILNKDFLTYQFCWGMIPRPNTRAGQPGRCPRC